jgi:NAD(P)-dependent dehydrogenase (short-subunit alcohol dehydrogenase family)
MLLDRKKALITGAQQGIGAAIAVAFADQGADVAINYLDDAAAAERVAAEVTARGRRAVLVQADVGETGRIDAFVREAEAGLGGLDVVVNNAGIFPRAHFLDLTEDTWDMTLNVNLKATCFIGQAAARRMVASGTAGAIVNIASSAVQGWERSAHYSASKGGVVSLTRTMAIDLAHSHIRVNAIAPGLTDTAQPRGGYSEQQLTDFAEHIPVRRMGQAGEIASVAVFLASAMSSYMTGQTVHVNGGAFMS